MNVLKVDYFVLICKPQHFGYITVVYPLEVSIFISYHSAIISFIRFVIVSLFTLFSSIFLAMRQ